MSHLNVLGIDTSKKSFFLHMNDNRGKTIFRKELKRDRFLAEIANTSKCTVILEACGSSHHWGREIRKLGHEVKLIPVQHVIPFRKSNKNDRNDAEAIAEAGSRGNMNFVAVKEIWQQDIQLLHRVRQRYIRNQTSLVNEVRGLVAEYGIFIAEGINSVRGFLPEVIQGKEGDLSLMVRGVLGRLHEELLCVTDNIEEVDKRLEQFAEEHDVCRRLDEIEGVGPITATALVASCGDPHSFKNGRQFAARLGLVPGHTQTGGKNSAPVMLGITKKGDSYLRYLLVQGGMCLVRATQRTAKNDAQTTRVEHVHSDVAQKEKEKDAPRRTRKKPNSVQEKFHKSEPRRAWLKRLIDERGSQKAAVAMANKNARIAWVILTKGAKYDPQKCFGKAV